MGAFAYDCDTFPFGRWHTGTIILPYPCHAGIPPVYRWEERVEAFVVVCAVYRSFFRLGIVAGHSVAVQSSDEP